MNRKPTEEAAPDPRSSSAATPRIYDPGDPCEVAGKASADGGTD